MSGLRSNDRREIQRVIDDSTRATDEVRKLLGELDIPPEYKSWTKHDTEGSAYNDLLVSPSNVRLPASQSPTWTTWLTDLESLNFSEGDIAHFAGMQLPHSYVPSSDIRPHVHFAPTSAMADTETVLWTITYTVASVWSVFPATTTVTATFTNNAESRAKLPADSLSGTNILENAHLIAGDATIPGTTGNGVELSAVISGSLTYSSAGTYNDDVIMISADSHIRINRLGSRQEYTG